MLLVRFATLLLLLLVLATLAAHAQDKNGTQTSCENGTCRQTACKTDMFGNTVCHSQSFAEQAPYVPSQQEQRQLTREASERERKWVAYCQPEIYVDLEGIGRYRYARPNCDMAILTAQNPRAPWLAEPATANAGPGAPSVGRDGSRARNNQRSRNVSVPR
jgi:hypothetical protein